MSERPVVIDFSEEEARTVAAILDLGADIVACTSSQMEVESVKELRQRFLNGIVIAQAEAVLRGLA